jgi:hypothetical protein
LKVDKKEDLDRQIVKSDYCTISFPDIGFEIPPQTQQGTLNTLEGFITRAIDGLQQQQNIRKVTDFETYEKLEAICDKFKGFLELKTSFKVIIDDPSGNSNIENLATVGKIDANLKSHEYFRTREQNRLIGLGYTQEEALKEQEEMENKDKEKNEENIDLFGDEEEFQDTLKDIEKIKRSRILTVDEEEERKKLENLKNRKVVSRTNIIDSEEDSIKFEESITTKKEIEQFFENCYNCGKLGILRMVRYF